MNPDLLIEKVQGKEELIDKDQLYTMDEEKPALTREATNNRVQGHHLRWLIIILLLAVTGGGGYWWLFMRNRVTTDNAYVKADTAEISSRIPGTVLRVLVDNDSPVQAGQVLVELDPADYEVLLDKEEGALTQAEAEVLAAEVTVAATDLQTAAQVEAAESALMAVRDKEREVRHRLDEIQNKKLAALADLNHSVKDSSRFDSLYRQGAGTERQQDQARTALKKARAQSGAIDAELAGARASLAAVSQEVDRAAAQLEAARSDRYQVEIQRHRLAGLKGRWDEQKAEVEAARLNLSYCTIAAPVSGYVAQKSIQVGDRIQPGQAIMAVVPLQDVYVEANFKETQLTHVRLGQPAVIKADIYPGQTYRGRVAGIRAGTGASFSLLPAENATGNWIKVVQRVPVKIKLDRPPPPESPLGVGFSLEVTIDTSDRSGRVLMTEKPVSSSRAIPPQP